MHFYASDFEPAQSEVFMTQGGHMFLKEYGYYKIRAFKHCPRFYLNYVSNALTRRPTASLIQSVVGDIAHEVIEAKTPPDAVRSMQQIERRLPTQHHDEAKRRAKRSLRGARQVIAQHPGKTIRKTFRWRDDGPGGLNCLFYTTPDKPLEDGNVITIIEAKSGRGEDLREHLRFHGIVAASSFQAIGQRPRIHLVGYLLDRQPLVRIGGNPNERDLSKLPPAVDFWYCWDFLAAEQEELRVEVRKIMAAEEAGLFPATVNDECPWCDYIETAPCPEGQEYALALEEARERRTRTSLGEIAHKSPAREVARKDDSRRKQA
jgi:hypothetical protein